tara:strand:- start:11045 stop:11773 length:729 start_codon:yes stop_codon:yes gene_type:complete
MKTQEVAKLYDNKIRGKYKREYEYGRWFENPIKKAGYEMTKETVEYFSKQVEFDHYLEVGPGPGTWTKLFLKENSEADFDLVDVSSEMLLLAKKALGNSSNIRLINSGFLEFVSHKKYDYFFSSRALEYFLDKQKFVDKLNQLLTHNAEGIIITKNPKKIRSKLSGRKLSKLHQHQIKPTDLKKLLRGKEFAILDIFPVTLNVPVIHIAAFNKILFYFFGKRRLNFISNFFAESYCIHFKKI